MAAAQSFSSKTKNKTRKKNFNYMQPQKTPKSQSNIEKEKQGITSPDFKLYQKTIVIKETIIVIKRV